MMHPHTTLRPVDDFVGLGVFATRPLPAGTIVWVRDPWDRVLDPSTVEPDLQGALERYAFTEADGTVLLTWDHGRFVNHACRPNCGGLDAGFDIALEPIPEGAQITNDYSALGRVDPFTCTCGEASCRGVVQTSNPSPTLIARFEDALARVDRVPQPLGARAAPWIEASLRQRFRRRAV